jgi:4-hydroxybenzoate polyprenyltransferase
MLMARSSSTGTAGLLRACHPGPAAAVTLLAGPLAAGAGLGLVRGVLVVAAVLAGQLVTGWLNDLLDAGRDRQVGRADKPVVSGAVDEATLRRALVLAAVPAVGLPLLAGLLAGPAAAVTGLAVVAGGVAYDLGLKATVASPAPYAVAFGALPAFVLLTGEQPVPAWLPVAGALLGVGAHLLNVLPDLDDDAVTGVRGLPHRLGVRLLAPAGVAVLLAATAVMVLGAPVTGVPLLVLAAVVTALTAAALAGSPRAAFRAAVGIALADAVLLVVLQAGGAG